MGRVIVENRTVDRLPPETDLRQSYFRNCTFDGLDFSGYDLRDCDFIQCTVRNCNLHSAEVRYLQSFETAWTGSTMPLNQSSVPGNHDQIAEIARQHAARFPRDRRPSLRLAQYLADYRTSWTDGIADMVAGGLTRTEAQELLGRMFAAYPFLMRRLNQTAELETLNPDKDPTTNPRDRLRITRDREFRHSRDFGDKGNRDRYAIARRLESAANTRLGRDDVNVWVEWLEPYPNVRVLTRDDHPEQFARWDWWHDLTSVAVDRDVTGG